MKVGYKIQVKGSIGFNLLGFGTIRNLKNDKKRKKNRNYQKTIV